MSAAEWKSESITVNYEGKPAYNILIEKDFGRLSQAVIHLGMSGRKFMIVSDSNVSRYYLDECIAIFKTISDRVESFVFDAGEASKNLNTVSVCYSRLISAGFDRNDVLVALGGGVIGDLTGFAAATYLRGIRFIQLPTSLLAMVDSSIGGKTGVDFKAYKNMVGAFHQPKLVYMNLSALLTLKDREFFSGMGEIIKHGLIKDQGYYQWLKEHSAEIASKELTILREMVFRSCLIKKDVVEQDPKEKGDRALLNFGHTIGHSVEKLKDFSLLHGECVCIGMTAAAFLSHQRGKLTLEQLQDIRQVIQSFRQPVNVDGLQAEEVYEVTRLDKKMDSDRIRFILLNSIGESYIDPSVTREELLQAIEYILN